MLASSKIALLCISLVVAAPACALVLGDFDPATTGGTGGAGGTMGVNGSVAAADAATGTGGAMSSTVSASSGGGGEGGGCPVACPASTLPCKVNVCVGSSCQETDAAPGTACPGGFCDAAGGCLAGTSSSSVSSSGTGGCTDLTCPMTGNVCITPVCNPNGTCSTSNVQSGTMAGMQMVGDCHSNVCDGNGGLMTMVNNNDPPPDMGPCSKPACSAGMPVYVPANAGQACGIANVCDNNGNCVIEMESSSSSSTGGGNSCFNGVHDVGEIGIDCGGACPKVCGIAGSPCVNPDDCVSRMCIMSICM
jgi:hypothetical protein